MKEILYVGIGGFLGASLRYLISKLFNADFPYGTLIVNILGGILIGFIMGLSLRNNLISKNLRLFLVTGILGGLTTFSTFSYETVEFFSSKNYLVGSVNLFSNLFFSLAGVVLGKTVSNFI